MTSVQEGQANQAFEANEDDTVVPDGPEKDTKKATKKATIEAFDPVDDIEDESSGCQFFGIFPLPEICSKYFLNAAWILIFLSWASTIQVNNLFLTYFIFLPKPKMLFELPTDHIQIVYSFCNLSKNLHLFKYFPFRVFNTWKIFQCIITGKILLVTV